MRTQPELVLGATPSCTDRSGWGGPPSRHSGGDLQSQNELNSEYWDKGVNEGFGQLANGPDGVELMNRIFLLVTEHGGDPGAVLNALWDKACDQISGGKFHKMAFPELSWPTPG